MNPKLSWRQQAVSVALLGATLISGCSGDSSPDSGLISTTPNSGSQAAEPNAQVTARFAEALQADTVDSSTFVVDQEGAAVAGTVSYDANEHEARFVASAPLEFLTPYRATLSGSILTSDGQPIDSAQWHFRTRDGRWSDEVALPKAIADAETREFGGLAFGPDGRSWLVWEELRGGSASVWVAQRQAGGSAWDTPVRLFLDDLGAIDTMHYPVHLQPRIAINAHGVATVVWQELNRPGEDDPVQSYIWAARWDGSAWSEAERIGAPGVGSGSSALVAVDGGDHSLVVWNQSVLAEGAVQLWAQRFTNGTGWSTPEKIGEARPWETRLEMAADGSARAIWQESNATNLWAADFDGQGTWTSPTRLVTTAIPGSFTSQQRPDHSSVVVWTQNEGNRLTSQWWSIRQADGQWTSAARLDDDMESHDIAVTPTGDILMGYVKAVEGSNAEVYTRRLAAGSGSWTTPVRLVSQTGAAPASRQIKIAVDDKGRGLLAFEQFLTTGSEHRLWTSRLADPSGDSWSEPQQRLDKNRLLTGLVVGPHGRASLVLRREDMGEDFADMRFD